MGVVVWNHSQYFKFIFIDIRNIVNSFQNNFMTPWTMSAAKCCVKYASWFRASLNHTDLFSRKVWCYSIHRYKVPVSLRIHLIYLKGIVCLKFHFREHWRRNMMHGVWYDTVYWRNSLQPCQLKSIVQFQVMNCKPIEMLFPQLFYCQWLQKYTCC